MIEFTQETIDKQDARRCPLVTVDIIIEILDWFPLAIFGNTLEPMKSQNGIVLIERKNEPHGYALPGGFVDIGETTAAAAAREALEETQLHVTQLEQFHTYSDPARDARGHAISIVYIGKAIGEPLAADDAKNAFIINPAQMGDWNTKELCFDHRQILTDYLIFKQTGKRPL